MDDERKLEEILRKESIYPVYQPIVSLENGEVYGYEALSRISGSSLEMPIETMFALADRVNKAWELEALCRGKALEGFASATPGTRLFLNVNPNIIHDEKFKEGFTKTRLEALGISSESITFEITERVSVLNGHLFQESVHHYQHQNYGIAIDDVGSGFSGLNAIVDIKPRFIKLDMHLIRNLDKDETKLLLCKALADFCKSAGIQLIAEGIESEEELRELIRLGVDYGQGYFLALPCSEFGAVQAEKCHLIEHYYTKHYLEKSQKSIYPVIEHLCRPGCVFSPSDTVEHIFATLEANPAIMEFTILEDNVVTGFMTRADIDSLLGGRYGFSLHAKKFVQQLNKPDFLRVNGDMRVDQVSRLAMQRPYKQLYNPIVVERENTYLGLVTIKDLLETCTKIEIDLAMHTNPLTGLPGNLLIEKEIGARIFGAGPYCITYYDLDNFKAYNDGYGFENGDLMLRLVAEILQECAAKGEFIGHIGGDDFIVVADYEQGESFCKKVLEQFHTRVLALYREDDIAHGYIVSKNRNGITENFPLAGLSIAGVTSKGKRYNNLDDFSRDVALLKKCSKKQPGSCYHLL